MVLNADEGRREGAAPKTELIATGVAGTVTALIASATAAEDK